MKKLIFTIFAAIVISSFATSANAQMMGGFSNTTVDWSEVVEHTANEVGAPHCNFIYQTILSSPLAYRSFKTSSADFS